MCSYREGKGEEVWLSIEKGPHTPTVTGGTGLGVEAALGGEPILTPTSDDILKMKADTSAKTKIIYAIPPDIFDFVEKCESAHEIWVTLQKIFERTKASKYKKMTSSLNAYTHFHVVPNESLQSTFKWFTVIMTRLNNSEHEK